MNDKLYDQQTLIIKQILLGLDMEDAFNHFIKTTPYYLSYNNYEYTPCDLILEESCPYGNNCLYKTTPLVCYKNHQLINKVIKKNQRIPNVICKYERPWKKLNGEPMRCQNIYCWFSHLKGRYDIIKNKSLTN